MAVTFNADAIIQTLRDDINNSGITPPDNIELGKITRFSDDGGKNKNAWAVLHINPNGTAGGAFGSWRGDTHKWFYEPDGFQLSQADKEFLGAQITEAKKKAEGERKMAQELAAKEAQTIWQRANPANPEHPYLKKKQIKPFGIKQMDSDLIIPIYVDGVLTSLQEIKSDGSKKFHTDGKIKDGFYVIGSLESSPIIYIGEGFGTMGSVFMASKNAACIASFSSWNLKGVAQIVKAQYPGKRIVITADNDLTTEKKTGTNPGRKAGEEAAASIDAEICISPIDSDFNDLHYSQGLNAVSQALKKTRRINDGPISLPDDLPPVQLFDYDLLPEMLRPWIQDISERMQCPPDFVAVAALGAIAAVLGRKVGIRPQARTDWTVVPNLWIMVVGRPGVLKSPALEAGLAPLKRLIAEANNTYQAAEEQYKVEALTAKLKQDAAEKTARTMLAKDPEADLSAVLAVGGEPVSPVLKRYQANDCTPASLGELLRQNPNGLLVFRDEVVSLLKSLDRDGQEEGRGFYLTAWNGDSPYTFDRIGRGLNLTILAICLSVLGGTQPGRLSEYIYQAVKGGSGDDGLIQRFGIMVWPDIPKKWKNVDRTPDYTAKNQAYEVFAYLDKLTPENVYAERDTDINGQPEGIPYLRFAPAALEVFTEWRSDLEQKLRSDEMLPALESHFSKYRKLIPSLALIFHLVDGGIGPVTETATLRALAWGQYLESHAYRAYGSITSPEISTAKAILKKIQTGKLKPEFGPTDVWRPGWSKLTDRDQVLKGLQVLEDHRWITAEDVPTGGRPKTVYHYNGGKDE